MHKKMNQSKSFIFLPFHEIQDYSCIFLCLIQEFVFSALGSINIQIVNIYILTEFTRFDFRRTFLDGIDILMFSNTHSKILCRRDDTKKYDE